MPRTWLLLLGSNLASDERLRAALLALRQLGSLNLVTPVARQAAREGSGDGAADYYNALATLEHQGERATLVAELKRIERELGRRHDSALVAIDIDLLACNEGAGWLADAHAIAKGDLERAPAARLLRAAGIAIQS